MMPIYWNEDRKSQSLIVFILILIFCGLQIIPTLGVVNLFDWDEINFAEAAREMVVTGNYSIVQIGFQPFWEKPPLFIWMQAVSMNIFGINEFAARFPNFLAAVFTLFSIYRIGSTLKNSQFAIIWTLLYFGSLLPNFYFHSGIIDPWYNLFSFLGIYYFWESNGQTKSYLYAGVYIGLAILTKGPVIIILLSLATLTTLILGKKERFPNLKNLIVFGISVIFTGGSWFIYLSTSGNYQLIGQFIEYQWRLLTTADAGHNGPWFYHILVLVLGCFPASIFALSKLTIDTKRTDFSFWMVILFWINLGIFTFVKTKIIHYSSFCYFPLTYLAADFLTQVDFTKVKYFKKIYSLAQIILLLLVFTLLFIPATIMLLEHATPDYLNFFDEALRSNLRQNLNWNFTDLIPGIILAALGEYGLILIFEDNKRSKGIMCLCLAVSLTIFSASYLTLPKIEKYTQGKFIEYLSIAAQNNVPVKTFYFKSYADLFYTKTKMNEPIGRNQTPEAFINLNQPLIFAVSKAESVNRLTAEYPSLTLDSISGGYAFFHSRKSP
jgi:hypothetical protein